MTAPDSPSVAAAAPPADPGPVTGPGPSAGQAAGQSAGQSVETPIAHRVALSVARLLGADRVTGLGVAVSGGSDSVALMHLLAPIARDRGLTLRVATVDHGLRPEAPDEAAGVAAKARALGLAHETLQWQGWDGQGNLQARARDARYRLLAGWASEQGLSHVALGHTADDQAETLLMRLARGAGVDGLSAMPGRRLVEGTVFLRPLLDETRQGLRDLLAGQGIGWVDDPGNDDTRFDRVRARQALAALSQIGLDRAALRQVAQNMTEARKALRWQTHLAARDCVTLCHGDVVIDRARLLLQPDEIIRRLILHGLEWISGAAYPPRRRPVLQLIAAIKAGEGGVLHGCRILCEQPSHLRILREGAALDGLRAAPGSVWDNRWRLIGPAAAAADLHVAALGPSGLAQCPDWRATRLPRHSLEASPALWRGADLVAAPLAGRSAGWRLLPARPPEDFFLRLMSQ